MAVSAVKVFWRWQAFPCRECFWGFLRGLITSEKRSLWGKGMDEHQDDDGETHIEHETDYSKVNW